jgi:hypothetical protein
MAEGRLAQLYEDKFKNAKAAKGVYARIGKYYEQLTKKQKDNLEIGALDPVARASFIDNEDDWRKYSNLKLRWSNVANTGELQNSIKAKAAALVEVQKAYTKTVALKSADPAICALHKIGMAYDQFADALMNFPVPKGLPEEVLIELRPQFEGQAEQPKQKAAEAFSAAVQKSQELDVFNACTTAALDMLRDKYKVATFPKVREDIMELKESADKQMAIGQDVLTSIQVVPTVSAEQAQQMKNKTKEVSGTKVAKDTAPNEMDLSDPAPAPKPKTNAPTKPKNDSEPEDTL